MFRILCIFVLWIGWSSYQPIRGKSTAPSILLMVDFYKRVDYMNKKKTLTQLLNEFRVVHGDKYDYSQVSEKNFLSNKSLIPIICKKHGVFYQVVQTHLSGCGCTTCGRTEQGGGLHIKKRKPLYGVGINDYIYPISKHGVQDVAYMSWKTMLGRCYGKKNIGTKYEKCTVCDDWLYFSNFKRWFDENHVDGYHLDKDILVKGNTVYSPQLCCFVPPEINTLITKHDATRGDLPIGVSFKKGRGKHYRAVLRKNIKYVHLGVFDTPIQAFVAYKQAKERYVKKVAQEYYNKGLIKENVYNALMNYKVEITD